MKIEKLPEWSYCYFRDGTQTIKVKDDLRCANYVNLDKYNYDSDLKHYHESDLDIMRIETRQGKIIWQRPFKTKCKEKGKINE